MKVATQKFSWKDLLAYGLFWSWNLIFLAFMVLGFAPRLLPDLLLSVREGMIPFEYLIYGLVLSIIPVISIVLGLTVLRGAPTRAFALGYVVEGPLMLLLTVRFFLIRQATPGVMMLMATAILGMGAFLWQLLDPKIERRGRLASTLRLAGLTLMLLTSLYAALWIAFYALPISASALEWLNKTLGNLTYFFGNFWASIKDLLRERIEWVFFSILGFLLLLYTATLFVLAPIAIPILSARAWWRSLKSLAKRSSWVLSSLTVLLTVAVTGLLFVAANQQPQRQIFALLEDPPATQEQVRVLLDQEEEIRGGLLNAYLAPFRYISAQGEVRHISDIYESTFDMKHSEAFGVQKFYEGVASPLLYQPVHPPDLTIQSDNRALVDEPREAARLYQRFFDERIVEGERETIVRAARANWSGEQAEAAWQAVDDREVHLARQEVNLQEHGDWAEVELYEVYENQTGNQQEVVYYFSLPESAVITGVWLGNGPDREERFEFQVAPRGAAQAVYRNETLRRRDPALVEQIGPRQYRLRVFPVQPVSLVYDETRSRSHKEDAPPLHMWLTYRVMFDGKNWPLPQLAVNRNVYWDKQTVRLTNGAPMKINEEDWLPESISASQPASLTAHRVDFPGGESVLARPVSEADLPSLPAGMRLAVVLDRSKSMEAIADQVSAALTELQTAAGADAVIDVYLTASPYRGEPPSVVSLPDLDVQNIVYFGGQNPAQLIVQFEELRQERDYDAILVFTDGSGYELGQGQEQAAIPEAPLWMVHLGGDLPLGYDDQTLEAIQASGGGVAGDLKQALERIAFAEANGQAGADSEEALRDMVDGMIWSTLPTAIAQSEAPEAQVHRNDGFEALAARRLILAEMQRQRGAIDEIETLDRLHALAKNYEVVTPYSSMIVLVNDEQQRLLEAMEKQGDRFEREVEAVGETTPAVQTPLTGVPEPEEWLLIGLAVALLIWYASRRHFAWQRHTPG